MPRSPTRSPKRLANDRDPAVRARLANREDLRPEILSLLAEDAEPEVRRHIAANRKTPSQADLIPARDSDECVRRKLADKVAQLSPELDAAAQEKTQQYLFEVIAVLAQD